MSFQLAYFRVSSCLVLPEVTHFLTSSSDIPHQRTRAQTNLRSSTGGFLLGVGILQLTLEQEDGDYPLGHSRV